MSSAVVLISYTNHRGETADRRIMPIRLTFGLVSWHPGRQWLLDAKDLDKGEIRTFAMKDIHSWTPIEEGASGRR